MAGESSFDVVSRVDHQEVDNALGQAAREVATRFDFKGTGASIRWSGTDGVLIEADTEPRAQAVLEVFRAKLVRRGVSLKALDVGEPKESGRVVRIAATVREGISAEHARELSALVRSRGPKGVQARVQGDELRVSGKKKDDLQSVMALLRDADVDVALQFVNYR